MASFEGETEASDHLVGKYIVLKYCPDKRVHEFSNAHKLYKRKHCLDVLISALGILFFSSW